MDAHAGQVYKRMHQTASDFIASYDQSKCQSDIHSLSSTLDKGCRRYFAPQSMFSQIPVLAEGRTNEQYEEQMRPELTNLWSKWHVDVQDIIVDESKRKAVVWSSHHMMTKQSKEYVFEFMFVLEMTESGEKVKKLWEYCDTHVVAKFMEEQQAIAQHLQEQKV